MFGFIYAEYCDAFNAGRAHEQKLTLAAPSVRDTTKVVTDALGNVLSVQSGIKPTNPKDAIGVMKVPLHLVSGVVKAYQAIAHYLGNVKYGAWNYRAGGARASVYVSALHRHIDRWWEGEECDQVDGTPHLANAQACLNILIEASVGKNLVDDRPPSRDLNPIYAEMESLMAKIKERYKDREPRHWTIDDKKV